MAVPTYQATGTSDTSAGAALTLPWPTHAVDDVALLFIESTGGQAVTLATPEGFAAHPLSPIATGAGLNGTQQTIYWARATSTSMASPTTTTVGNHLFGVILTFRGCITTGDPYSTGASDVKAAASTSATFPTVTTTEDDSLIVLAITSDVDAATAFASSPVNANLTNFVEHFDLGVTSGNGGGIAVTSATMATAGATGTTALTVVSSINAMATIPLLPAPVVPPGLGSNLLTMGIN